MKKLVISSILALVLLASLGLVGCTVPTVQAKTGTIEVRVTDAPAGYTVTSIKIWVAENGVEVHKAVAEQEQEETQTQTQTQEEQEEGEWIPIDIIEGKNPFELLDYTGGLQGVLAISEVEAGRYSQIRMTIDKVEVTILEDGETEGTTYEAKLPSGKLRFVRPFDVVEGETTALVLDFIAEKSVNITGAVKNDSAKVIFKPVIKLTVQQGREPREAATVEGTISAVDTGASTISIIPTGETEAIVLGVNPQKTEITLDGELAALVGLDGLGQGNTVIASYYVDDLRAIQIDALSPPP